MGMETEAITTQSDSQPLATAIAPSIPNPPADNTPKIENPTGQTATPGSGSIGVSTMQEGSTTLSNNTLAPPESNPAMEAPSNVADATPANTLSGTQPLPPPSVQGVPPSY